MSSRTFARAFGIVFLLIGIAGFIPGITAPHSHPDVTVDAFLELELGLFPVNLLHKCRSHCLWGLGTGPVPVSK